MKLSSFETVKQALKKIKAEPIVVSLLTAYSLCASAVLLITRLFFQTSFTALAFMERGSVIGTALGILVVSAVLFFLSVRKGLFEKTKKLLLFSGCFYFLLLCYYGYSPWFYVFLCIFLAVAVFYCIKKEETPALSVRAGPLLVTAAVCVFLLAATASVFRGMGSNAGAEDTGVYSQMFYHMAKNGQTLYSVTEDAPTIRFRSQPSVLLYAFLPFYFLTRTLTPLLVVQCAALVSGVVPLYLICKRRAVKPPVLVTVCLVYLLHPGIWSGAFFGFHEQCLLPALLLWMLYCAEKKNTVWLMLIVVLTVLVGGEGVILTFCVALYVIFGLKRRVDGAVSMALSLLGYFLYKLLCPEFTLLRLPLPFADWLRALVGDPGYILGTLFSEEKIVFLLTLLLPLAFLPLFVKNRSAYVLLLPLLVVGLFSSLAEDFSVTRQHAFGVSALLIYGFLLALSDKKTEGRRATFFALTACLMVFCGTFLPQTNSVSAFIRDRELLDSRKECVRLVPEGASVTASSQLTPLLAERDELYLYTPDQTAEDGSTVSCQKVYQTEYTVLTLNGDDAVANEEKMYRLLSEGFELVDMREYNVVVLHRPAV